MEPNWTRLLLLLSPILLIETALAVYSLIDLKRRPIVRGSRTVWAILLVITMFTVPSGLIVSGLYLAWGRNAEQTDDSD